MASTPALATRVESLSAVKRALLDKWRASQPDRPGPSEIPRRGEKTASLSFTQQRLWFFDQLEPKNPCYNVATAVRLLGPLDPRVLEAALRGVIARHDILRTTFHDAGGVPCQQVTTDFDWSMDRVSLAALPASAREDSWRELAATEAQRPFDLTTGPLIRATLVELTAAEHVLLLTLHHIVCDGWSMGVLRHEVAELYESLVAGRAPRLDPLPIQYADYATWQREQLRGDELQRLLDYWSQQLDPPPPPLELPLDYPRPAAPTYQGATCRRHIDSELLAGLRETARREGVTLFMLLEAAVHLLLARWSGQRDLCIGTPVANRDHAQLERLIGFFANTLALRVDLSAELTLRELLARVKAATLEAFSHQALPFEQLVDQLQIPRDLSRTPLFQVLFVLQNIPLRPQQIAGLTAAEISFDHAPVAMFDLTWNLQESPQGLEISLIYNRDLFAAPTIDRLAQAYGTLLAEFNGELDRSAWQVPLTTAAERSQLLAWSHGPAKDFPQASCLHELIAAQAARTPRAIAVRCGDSQLTYAELNARAERLARYLSRRGVAPDVAVGLMLDRSLDLIVGLLAILKAGGAYVPLDPDYPTPRLAYMVRDAGARLVLTNSAHADRLPAGVCGQVLVDRDADAIDAAQAVVDDSLVMSPASPRHLAYIIYTSGSTGEPKGVEVEHRGLVNHALQFAERLPLTVGDGMLQYLSPSFDAAGEEFFPTLISGATLVLHPAPAELFGRALLEWSRTHGVNVLHLTPAVWLSLLDELSATGARGANHLKAVVVGGDNVRRDAVARWLQLTEGAIPVYLAYGVTEASITTTLCDAREPHATSGTSRMPIGRPLPNTSVLVLDPSGGLAPIGVAGELYLGGVGVARGYRDRPELTRERFGPDPYQDDPTARLYRTGDRGRWLADGQIEFLGRFDQQLKIRGYRIEPGEIEAVLRRCRGVRDAAVVARCDRAGHPRLVAYVEVGDAVDLTAADLGDFARTELPTHLVPAHFAVLASLPRLPNGKLDRSSLPQRLPDHNRPSAAIAPRSEAEQALAAVWSDVLGVTPISIDDNYFEIGGDSIRSIQIVARARDAGWQITPKQLFQNQTIAALARVARRAASICAEQGDVTGPLPLTPIQHEFFALNLAARHHFNQSVLLELRRTVAPSVVEDALQNVLRQHDSLRVAYHRDPATGWSQQGMPYRRCELLQIVDLSQTPDQECAVEIERAGSTSQASLDLEAGRLLAAVFFDLGPERPARLLIAIHHLAIDAVSWRILLEDLGAAIDALSRGTPPRLAPKTTSFATWSRRLCTLADQPEVRAEVAQWSNPATAEALANPAANLVVDEAACEARFSTDDTTRWLRDANAAYRTRPHELLIAALVQVLNSHQGVDAQLLELEGHGREELFEDVDLSRTVGWFTTLSPRRLILGPNASAADAIRSIKEQLRVVPRNGLGFGLLRWLTSDAQVRAALATVQRGAISFNYLGQFDQWLPADAPFALLEEPAGATRSPLGQRPHAWEIIAYVRAGRLTVSWRYSRRLHSPEQIERLAAAHLESLRALVEHCLEPQAGGATPSDFPRAGLDQSGLDELAAALTKQAPQASRSCPPLRRIADVLPLAPLQELMLPQALARRGTGELVEQFQCTLRGTLDPARLRSAAQQAIERHALLRASFIWSDVRHPQILVHQHSELPWTEEDWRSAPPGGQVARLAAWLEHDRREGFDLARAPLVRFCLLRIGDGEWRFVWTCHHLVADGWSAALVLKDVFAGYGRVPTGQEIEPRPTGQFADYLSWLEARTPSEAAAYWREHLANAQPTPSLPSLDSRDVVGESPREHVEFLSPSVVARLTELAKSERVSLATVLQAAWGMLLARFTGVDDVVFGVAVAGRPALVPGVDEIVGPLMNNVPLRVSIDWRRPLGEHLRGVQAQRVGAEPHEHVTLAEVARAANWPAAQRLFETLLVVENYPWSNSRGAEVAGLQVDEIRGTTSSNYPLTLVAIPGEQLELRLQFDPQRLGPDDTRRILDHFATMLAAMGAGECHALQDLRILSRRERDVLAHASRSMPERVLDRWGTCAPIGVTGEIWTTTAMPQRDAAGTAARETRPDPLAIESDVQLYPTGYRGRWLPSGAVEWLGPASASVQIGHYRTDPRELTSILALHPLVDDCAIIARSSATGDDELVAYVVANPAAATLLDSAQSGLLVDRLRGFLASRVPEALVPRMWRTVPTLGRTSTGAIDLEQLPSVFRPRGQAPHPYRAPRDLLEERLARVWSEVLGVEPIGLDDDFLDLGGHSSLAVALLARLESEFGRELSLAALLEQPTIAHLAELLNRDPRSSAVSPLVPIRAQGSRPPLFCVHPAGGTVMCYRELARRLDDEVPVYGLQAQGIDDDRPPLEAITELAASYLSAIRSVQPEGPYQLCGWSTGGIIAFEIARQLAASGAAVGLLALVDAAIPRAGESFGESDLAALLSMLFPGEDLAQLRDKSSDEQLREFSERAQRAGLLGAEAASRQANRIYQVFQANLRGVADYRPGPLQGCSLTILRATQHATPMHADPWLGWQPWAEGGIEVLEVDASHLDILEAPAVEQVAKTLGPRLAAAL